MDRLAKQARTSLTPELSPHSDVVPPPSPQVPPSLTSIPSEVAAADGEARVSFYVQSIDEMLERVLDQESFLFTSVERTALERFQSMGYEARYLFMRLYLRKHTWIRGDTIGYESDISDVDATCDALCEKFVRGEEEEEVREKGQVKKAEEIDLTASQDTVIDLTVSDEEEEMDLVDNTQPAAGEMTAAEERAELSRIAFDEDVLAESSAEDILAILKLDELADLGRRLKVVAKRGTRKEWTQALLKTSTQSTLTFFMSPASKKGKEKENHLGVSFDSKGKKHTQSSVVSSHALKIIGPCIRITPAYVSLFDRLSLIYHRTAYSSSSGISSLTSSLLARFGKRNYPTYVVSRSFSIFPSRHLLRQYEDALQIEGKVEEALGENWKTAPASSGPRTEVEKKGDREAMWEEGIRLFESIRAAWGGMCVEEEGKGEGEEGKLMYYRRRFHPGWPLTRVVYKAAAILARLHRHAEEKVLLKALLAQNCFRRGKRGDWYDRLALILMKYPSKEEEDEVKDAKKERMARRRLKEALALCLEGLEDPFTHLIYKASLRRRIVRIESKLKVEKADKHTFEKGLGKAPVRIMEGDRLDDPTPGHHSVWRADDGEEISVEELVLAQYVKEGWSGFHSENSILTTIFALLFWDVLFTPIDGVFETAYQAAPLDLATDAFCLVRKPLIAKRLASIAAGKAASILSKVDDRERPRNTFCVGVSWDKYSKEDLLDIVRGLGGDALVKITTVFCEEYGHRSGGVPDLCLWDDDGNVKFSEVKGPGDTLSETQRVWIDLLLTAGVEVEVCKVMTSEDKKAMDELAEENREKRKSGKRGRTVDEDGEDPDEED